MLASSRQLQTASTVCLQCQFVMWDDGDPVVHDWCIQQNAVLVLQQSSKLVSVYYRPCSDRWFVCTCKFTCLTTPIGISKQSVVVLVVVTAHIAQ